MEKNCLPSDSDVSKISCKLNGNCSQQQEMAQVNQKIEQLQNELKDLKDFQNKIEIWIGNLSAHLNRLDIPTDPDTLEAYNEYSCGNHYDW